MPLGMQLRVHDIDTYGEAEDGGPQRTKAFVVGVAALAAWPVACAAIPAFRQT